MDTQDNTDTESASTVNNDELRQVLDKFIEDFNSNNIQFDTDNGELDDSPKKLIDCPHEIVFSVNANVLSQNEKGEHIATEEICLKNYHIPVPIGQDYQQFMSIFFQHLEKAIESSYTQTTKDNNNE